MSGMGNDDSAIHGFAFALAAYVMWGMMPLYFKAASYVPPVDIVAYRVLFSVPVAGCVLLWLRRTADLKAAFHHPRTLLLAGLTASLIAVNWTIYTWAVIAERTIEAALGYYINPLVNIVLGALFLGERFDKWQFTAIGLAVAAVLILTVHAGGPPWISLSLALSFGVYGFLRKTLRFVPSQGFFLEVLLLSIPSLIVLFAISPTGGQDLWDDGPAGTLLVLAAGPVTAIPLILYAAGAKRLRYSTMGLMQYVAPSLIFLIAVFVFREPFSAWQLLAFCLIWSALAIYSWSTLAYGAGSSISPLRRIRMRVE